MGEPKMPVFNSPEYWEKHKQEVSSPEYQEKNAKAMEKHVQEKKEQARINLIEQIEDMRAGKRFRNDTMEGLFEKSFEAWNPEKPEQIPSVFSAEYREMADAVLKETGLTEEEARGYVEKADAKEYSDGITQLVSELREGKMKNMSFRGVNAVDTFFDPNLEPATLPWYTPTGDFITSEKKREIISKVLTETGLTEEEARGFLASKEC
jgi:hypothetical protein